MLLAALVFSACGGTPAIDGVVDLHLDTRDPLTMASFYLGAYMDSTEVRQVLGRGEGSTLDLRALAGLAPGLALALGQPSADGVVSRDEFLQAVGSTYPTARALPDSLAEFRGRHGMQPTSGREWLQFEVSGSMTRYRRRLQIGVQEVRAALAGVSATSRDLHYPVGTVVLGEHMDGARVVETTAMVRRSDGYWDFVAFDSTGRRTDTIWGATDPLSVPADCFGCHYGSRLFEPEKSFPSDVGPGPWGERGVFVESHFRREDAVAFLDEHRRRADGLLGLYGTLYLSDLLSRAGRGERLDSLGSALVGLIRN